MTGAHLTLVRAPNPGPLTGPGTNTWIFGSGEVVVIDPGPLLDDHLQRVAAAGADLGRVAAVVCTHHHLDHMEGAERLCQMVDAPLAVFYRLARNQGDLPLHDGDRLIAGNQELKVVHTPGHAADHICLLAAEEGLLFTGDHVLSGTTSVIWPPDGDMSAYLDSLQRVLELGARRLLPGHGGPIEDPNTALHALIAHRLDRERQILELLRGGASNPDSIVQRLYAGYPRDVWGAASKTVLAHCLRLEERGELRRVPAGDGAMFEVVSP